MKGHRILKKPEFLTLSRAVAILACPEGLEPPTCCLEGSCSIQLSYGQKVDVRKNGRSGGIRTRDPLLPKQMRYQAALRSDEAVIVACSA